MVEEPTVEDTIKILEGLRDRYEAHHRVKITDEAIKGSSRTYQIDILQIDFYLIRL